MRASFSTGAIAQLGERCNGIAEVGGSIPPSSTTKCKVENDMIALIGKIVAYIGLFISVVGFVAGFWLMFQDTNDDLAKMFLMSIPFGFVILFTGFTTVIMFSPRESELQAAQKKESNK